MRFTSSLLLGSVFATLAAGCAADTEDRAELVAVLPLTGEFRNKGFVHKSAIQDAVVQLEEAGLADQIGKPIALTLIDSGDNAEAVAQELDRVLADKDVLGIISSAGAAHEGSLRAAMRENIVHFEVSSGSDDEEFLFCAEREQYDMSYAFMTRGLCHTEAVMTARFLMAKYPGGRVALVRGSEAHDIMHTEVVRSEVERLNAEAVAAGRPEDQVTIVNSAASEDSEYALSYAVGNFAVELNMLKTDHQPDAIFWHLRGDDTNLRFMKDAKEAGFQGDLVTCGMSRSLALLDDEHTGGYLNYLADRLYFIMRAPPKTADLTDYQSEFLTNWSLNPDTYAPAAHDAMALIGLGLARTAGQGKADLRDAIVDVSRPGGETQTYKNMGNAIDRLAGGEDINYDGPSGSLDIRGCAAVGSGACPDTDKHFVPAAYYVEVARADSGAAAGTYQILNDWSTQPIIIE